ncbi:MAG: hypothetical protein HOV71_09650 [Hamadaea sp.]|uniref:hypothetical protein n=1 Tax=Hamadaea sp. NPDC050747 TaxID=3155789 RepID=UPI0017979573|nr:hypothetical protein [Hamadaea sp.]NUR48385.1 hypothetical protein [Hamadaea sp.]NUT03451.1 hypothetical protein [Hamadaea sp.]
MDDHRLTDERLCWLAVRDQIEAKTRPSLLMRILSAGSSRYGHDEARSHQRDHMGAYAEAVFDAAQELSADDRRILRRNGVVPDWFLARVRELYRDDQLRDR